MEKYMDSRELMEMKEQLSILTKKLEKETIVNEKLMRRATKEKISKMQRRALIKGIFIGLCIPYVIGVFHFIGLSLWLCGFTVLILLIALYCDYRIHRNIHSDEAMYGNLLDVRKKVLRIKQAYKDWLKFSIPILTLWLICFWYETFQLPDIPKESIFIGSISGGIIGGFIGFLQYKKMQRSADEILEQIEEMQA